MSMISFLFIGFSTVLCLSLYVLRILVRSGEKYIKISKYLILFASIIFLSYADFRFTILILLLALTTWYGGKKPTFNTIGIVAAIVNLGYFKYTNFFYESFAKIFNEDFVALKIILPIGISFYTFSAIAYLIDIKRGKLQSRSYADVLLYLSFYPKLVSGPIQRAGDFFEQMEKERRLDFQVVSTGLQIFVFGLFKKIVLADHLGVFVDQVYATPRAFNSFSVFLAAVAYSLQIYFDFSGYSDMAIGAAKVIGFNLPRNFNLPYLSYNVTEFWKRWHITLSSWLQDYLYISLGGSRKGKIRTYVNLMATMVIGGLWHGANWTYIAWGFLHGLALVIHKIWMKISNSNETEHGLVGKIISTIITFFFATLCWIFFRAESIEQAFVIIKRIFSFETGINQPYVWVFVGLIILLSGSFLAIKNSSENKSKPHKKNMNLADGYYPLQDLSTIRGMVLFFVFCGLLLCFAYTGGSPFIYGKY